LSVITCENLGKNYRDLKAIKDFSLAIEENTITGLIGRNGAGKTTLLKLIAGHLRPSAGEIKVFSRNPYNNLAVSANLIFVDDRMAFPARLSLAEILRQAGAFYRDWDEDLAFKLLDYFDLNPKQYHNRLSKGMKSTFNVILGLASRAALTIFDEPTTGMDAAVRKDFYRALLKDYVEFPRTIILSSHLIAEIENILEDILLIKDGQKKLHLSLIEFREYALGLRGDRELILNLLADWQADPGTPPEILYRENFAANSVYCVLRNNLQADRWQKISELGLKPTPVSTEDLCVYLTARSEGGINDVFGS